MEKLLNEALVTPTPESWVSYMLLCDSWKKSSSSGINCPVSSSVRFSGDIMQVNLLIALNGIDIGLSLPVWHFQLEWIYNFSLYIYIFADAIVSSRLYEG